MAEGILRKLVAESPTAGVEITVGSAGTLGLSGAPATDLATAVASEYDIDLTAHRSRALTPRLLAESDLVFALAAEHYDACRRMGRSEDTLFMLCAYPDHSPDRVSDSIPDPIGGNRARYEEAFFQIDEAIRRSFPVIQAAAGQRAADAG
jgi:protein-tyrosine-phosphatase